MCGRYALYDTDKLDARYGLDDSIPVEPNYNTSPTQTMPVITEGGIQLMRWGLIPHWAKDEKIGYKLFNARSESIFEKPIWKHAVEKRRCLVPANGFYEWKNLADGKHPFFIHLKDENILSFAGIWETWTHGDYEWRTYSILTTEPNKEMAEIHNRMPVILRRDDEQSWLQAGSRDHIEAFLLPYDDNSFDVYEVGREVNFSKTNNASLVKPI